MFTFQGQKFPTLSEAKYAALSKVYAGGKRYDPATGLFQELPPATFSISVPQPPFPDVNTFVVNDESFKTLEEALRYVWIEGAGHYYIGAVAGDGNHLGYLDPEAAEPTWIEL